MRLGWRTVRVLGYQGRPGGNASAHAHQVHDGPDERHGLCRAAGHGCRSGRRPRAEAPAKLSVIGADAIDVRLGPVAADDSVEHGTLSVAIANTGSQATTVEPTAFLGNLTASRGVCTVDRVDTKLDATSIEPRRASADDHVHAGSKGLCGQRRHRCMLAGDAGVEPATVGFVLSRQLPDTDLWKPFLGAFVAAMVTEACAAARICSRAGAKRLGWFKAEVAVGPTWSFKDSWLTNVAAVGALLGTILGAGDFLKDLIPGTSTVRLTAVSIIAGGGW